MAEPPDLVLEQLAQRLDQPQPHVLGQPADVVVALDHRRRAVGAAGLDEVRVQRALDEELGLDQPAGVLLEDADELVADRLALGLRVGDAGEAGEEALAGVDVDQLDAHRPPERLGDLLALALAHQPGVDVDARQLVADGPVHERRGDRRVDAAGQRAEHPAVADLGADAGDLLVDDRRHRPRRRAARPLVEEAPQHAHAVRRVDDLGVELHAVDPPLVVLQHGDRGVVGRRGRGEPGRRRGDGVEVAHPHVVHVGGVVGQEQRRRRCGAAWPGRTRRACPARRCRRAAGRSAGRRSRCRGSGRRARRSPGRATARRRRGRSSGPPDRISAAGRRAATSAAVMRLGTISEYTASSRTRRAISWAYWAPKSTTSTACSCVGGGSRADRRVQGFDRRQRW